MLRSLYSGVSGLKNFQTKLDVIGNNIANVNTFGYKKGRATFKDMISQTIQGGGTVGANPQQVGLGSQIGTIDTIDTQGNLQNTGRVLDLAIQGDGYFTVQKYDSDSNELIGSPYYTRAGNFYLAPDPNDENISYVVTSTGEKLLDKDGNSISIPTDAENLSIGPDGTVSYQSANPIDPPQQIGLVRFSNPGGLEKAGGNLYQETTNSGAPLPAQIPGEGGTGTLQSCELEMSNVDLADEFTEMIVAQRAFQANTKIITTSDDILQELVNLKR